MQVQSSVSPEAGPLQPQTNGTTPFPSLAAPKTSGGIGGRGTERRADGVVYTPNKKRCAVYYVFGDATMRTISVKERAKKLGVGMPTMYDWRKSYPEAWSALDKLDANFAATQEVREIMSCQATQNLAFFLSPDDPAMWSASGAAARSITGANGTNVTIATSSIINSASTQPAFQSRSTTTSIFVRPDGLRPEAEPEEPFGGRGPGRLPPELVEQLAKEGALATDDEIAAVHATTLDDDAGPGAAPYINETIDLTLHLKQSTLAPKVKENWDRCKRHFLASWGCLNRIRAQQQQNDVSLDDSVPNEGSDAEEEEIPVSEQKLVTYLK